MNSNLKVFAAQLNVIDGKVAMPAGAIPLSVAVHEGQIKMWAAVNSEAELREYDVYSIMTGEDMPPGISFVGTVILDNQAVCHIFIKL